MTTGYFQVYDGRMLLKELDTVGNCQRPGFSLCVSKHMNKITSLRTFALNWSLKLQENDERKKHPCLYKIVCFQIGIKGFRPEVFYYFSEKLPLSQKLSYFRGSHFPQCFILSTALQCLLPSQFLS